MGARGFGNLSPVVVAAFCSLALAACSSQANAARADAGEVSDTGPPIVDVGQSMDENCGPTGHAVTWGQPPSDCTIDLPQVPPSPVNLWVTAEGTTVVPRDDVNGWSFEAGTMAITLNGTFCQAVLDGTITNLVVVFGCPSHPHP